MTDRRIDLTVKTKDAEVTIGMTVIVSALGAREQDHLDHATTTALNILDAVAAREPKEEKTDG